MQNFELRLVIAILKLVMWMKRLDISIDNSNKLNAELLLRQSSYFGAHLDYNVSKVCVCGL